ncbi:hypothetical protein CLOBOL_03443 [Enterocloster bolteae ATCC BAA-613]|uniref:Uncharacterized protein n=1 Tax=Enterocloster bolteae (strain ATCC BAA-613 / DSM 15670 / CCUG 46953 / JCM 12243 / WAL 16351) TaxID=411902 RepID=A8RSU4_ENTBW|nr:hypothetical protein CLOBOL_03443 [Enterocloster bolteae ATCC BAA-613]
MFAPLPESACIPAGICAFVFVCLFICLFIAYLYNII